MESLKIISIEGKELYRCKEEGYSSTFENKGKKITKKIFIGTLPNSLELQRMIKEYKIKKTSTKIIIDVTFNKPYNEYLKDEKGNSIKDENGKYITIESKRKTQKQLREYLYNNGFDLDGIHYVCYKRSSSKSRNGSDLFIQDKKFKEMMNWSRIATNNRMKFKENELINVASLKAYESLSLSALESNITINPSSILLVPDINSKFSCKASVTRLDKDNKPYTSYEEEIELTNSIFDGEGLADSSLFSGEYSNKGMLLLRARFLKCCVFNTNIEKFMREEFKENYDSATVTDMFGNEIKVSEIKIITTPQSIKFLKMKDKFKTEKECYKYWIDNVGDNWGICKTEHPSKVEGYNQLSYQMINSLDLSEKEVGELAKEEVTYINLLKNDIAVFKRHIELSDDSLSRDMMLNLLNMNKDFKNTSIFKKWKKQQVETYIEKIRKGKIKIANSDYATITSNPYELLLSSVGRFKEGDKPVVLKDNEVFCTKYKFDTKLCGFRNPNINQGNVILFKNTDNEIFRDYFTFTENIIVVNSINYYIQDRLQGQDVDSDSCILFNSEVLVQKAEDNLKYPTPVNRIKLENKNRPYNKQQLAEVDNLIAENLIGKIVNTSQRILSLYWDKLHNKADKQELEKLYKYSSMCSSLSQIEIDKAKKFFDLPIEQFIKDIERNIDIINPLFFNKALGKKKKCRNMECPMDYLQKYISNNVVEADDVKSKPISKILIKANTREESNRNQIPQIIEIVEGLNNILNPLRAELRKCKEDDKEGKSKLRNKIKLETDKTISDINKRIIHMETLVDIFEDLEKEHSNIGVLLLSLMFNSKYQKEFLESFKLNSNENEERLEELEDEKYDVEIWGKKYRHI